jgi:release factor glutamine methyltransferase
MLEAASGLDRASFSADPDRPLDPGAGRSFAAMVRRRIRREPVAYILGRKGFRRIELEVDRRVLIPRPETELLVEVALELRPRRVLDIGTGSGAVALAIADELESTRVTATDRSAGALAVARRNAERLGLAQRVRIEPGTFPAGERFDLVVANLPYVSGGEWQRLAPEIREHEPPQALVAGPTGLEAIEALIRSFDPGACRTAFGAIALEVGRGQAARVEALLRGIGLQRVERRRDLAGIERVVVAR